MKKMKKLRMSDLIQKELKKIEKNYKVSKI